MSRGVPFGSAVAFVNARPATVLKKPPAPGSMPARPRPIPTASRAFGPSGGASPGGTDELDAGGGTDAFGAGAAAAGSGVGAAAGVAGATCGAVEPGIGVDGPTPFPTPALPSFIEVLASAGLGAGAGLGAAFAVLVEAGGVEASAKPEATEPVGLSLAGSVETTGAAGLGASYMPENGAAACAGGALPSPGGNCGVAGGVASAAGFGGMQLALAGSQVWALVES